MSGYNQPENLRISVEVGGNNDTVKLDARNKKYKTSSHNRRRVPIDSETNLNKRKLRFGLPAGDENEPEYSPTRKKRRYNHNEEDVDDALLFSQEQRQRREQRFGKSKPQGIDKALEPSKKRKYNKNKKTKFNSHKRAAKTNELASSQDIAEDEEELKKRQARAKRFEGRNTKGPKQASKVAGKNTHKNAATSSRGASSSTNPAAPKTNPTEPKKRRNTKHEAPEVTDLTKMDQDDAVLSPTDFLNSVLPQQDKQVSDSPRAKKQPEQNPTKVDETDVISYETDSNSPTESLEHSTKAEEAQMEIKALKQEVEKQTNRIQSQNQQLVTIRKDLLAQQKENKKLKEDVTKWQNQSFQHVGKLKHLEDKIAQMEKKAENQQQLIRKLRTTEVEYNELKKKVANLIG